MFDNKTLKVQFAQEMLFLRLKCVRAPAQSTPTQTSNVQFELQARPNDQIHTKYVKMAGYQSIHLNTVYVLSGREQLGENPMCVNILS